MIFFEALENDKSIGNCTLCLKDDIADVTSLSFDNAAPYAVEGLIKAAYNYACLRNYYVAKCSADGIDSFLKTMGFDIVSGEYVSDIPTILMGSCGSCHHKSNS